MGRSYTPKYAFKVIDHTSLAWSDPMEWNPRVYGDPRNHKNLIKYKDAFNKSLMPGGVNAHLGLSYRIRQMKVYRQRDGVIISEYPSVFPNPHFHKSKFTPSQLAALRKSYAPIKTAPVSILSKFRGLFAKMTDDQIIQLAQAGINFASKLALNEVLRRGIINKLRK